MLFDNDSDTGITGCNSRGATNENERSIWLDLETDHKRIRYDQKFIKMNSQIREFTSIVEALADQITSTKTNPERNTPVNFEENTHESVNQIHCVIMATREKENEANVSSRENEPIGLSTSMRYNRKNNSEENDTNASRNNWNLIKFIKLSGQL